MKKLIPAYSTYEEAVADLDNLAIGQVVSVDETLRMYRVEDNVEKELVAITNGANFQYANSYLYITF